jgi:hypothetical protein
MKRHFSIAAVSAVLIATCFGQRAMHAAPASSSVSSHHAASKQAVKTATPVASKVQAAKFQQVALGLNLNPNQKKSVGNLVQQTHQQLEANSSNRALSQEQRAVAAKEIKSDMVEKFVTLLTPEQKKELALMLTKRRQQQQQQSSANSSSGGSASAPSAPDIPSVDAPSASDDHSEQASTSRSDTASAPTDSSSATASTAGAQASATKSESADPVSDKAKSGQLTDAQLAAILNSFIQDDAGQVAAKPLGPDVDGDPLS